MKCTSPTQDSITKKRNKMLKIEFVEKEILGSKDKREF